MNSNANLGVSQLKQALKIGQQIEKLQAKLKHILGGDISAAHPGGRRKMSAAARKKIAAAQKARWAKPSGKPVKPKRTMSAAARAKIAAAAKRRWKAAKAAGKTTL
jgi:hypothetical protein